MKLKNNLSQMKNLIVCIQILLLIVVLPGCDGPKKSNTQNTSTKVEEAAPVSSESAAAMDEARANDTIGQRIRKMDDMVKGAASIDNMVMTITQKLGLDEVQSSSLKDIVTKGFIASGRGLDKEYTVAEARNYKHEILQGSMDKIMSFLKPDQQEKFKNLLNN